MSHSRRQAGPPDAGPGVRRDSTPAWLESAAKEVFGTLGKQIREWEDSFEERPETDREFGVILSPVTGPDTNVLDVPNAFLQVLRGTLAFGEPGASPPAVHRVSVLDIKVPDAAGTTARHSFLITALPSRMVRGTLTIPLFHSFAFVRAATSGYAGTGPQVYKMIREAIDKEAPHVFRTELTLRRDPLDLLFPLFGPVLGVRWPDELYPPRPRWGEVDPDSGSD